MQSILKRSLLTLSQITLGLCVASTASLAEHHEKAMKPAKAAKEAPAKTPAKPATKTTSATQTAPTIKAATIIKFDAKEVNGAKVWLPKESTAKAGEAVTLEIHNSLEAPHGFKIEGYVPETTIGAGETKSFTFTPKAKGVLKVMCHLHPAHVGAEIKVQ
jgi:FtsP/CotA-like multicopper oxidase with cupredoxin domain